MKPTHRAHTPRSAVTGLIVVVLLTLAGCASPGDQRSTTLAPGQLFKGTYLDVRAPMSGMWEPLRATDSGMAFARDGEAVDSTFVAQVATFRLQPTGTPAEFEALIRAFVERDTDPGRFSVQQASYRYSDERGYPCVSYRTEMQDRAAPKSRYPLLLEIDALYCRHPVRQDVGFAAIYSHRGPTPYGPLRSEAASFIAGVQVPDR